tara:strand:+ start:709 stop:852 length:144 start_codon:yes stop_codon:yes gene_type:complete
LVPHAQKGTVAGYFRSVPHAQTALNTAAIFVRLRTAIWHPLQFNNSN